MPPLTPDEATDLKVSMIPEDVFEVVNKLIAADYTGTRATVYQKDVVSELALLGYSEHQLLNENWLDFEPAYQKSGWECTYDKPVGYAGENYAAHWVFERKRGMS